jgi:excisionase family DNA binding protein
MPTARIPESEPLLTPAEVASMFRVDPKTVTRWAKAGRLTSIRTLGGHRRYRETEVRALLAGIPVAALCPDCRYRIDSAGHRTTCG